MLENYFLNMCSDSSSAGLRVRQVLYADLQHNLQLGSQHTID